MVDRHEDWAADRRSDYDARLNALDSRLRAIETNDISARLRVLEVTVAWWTKTLTALLLLIAAAMIGLAGTIGIHVIQSSSVDMSDLGRQGTHLR